MARSYPARSLRRSVFRRPSFESYRRRNRNLGAAPTSTTPVRVTAAQVQVASINPAVPEARVTASQVQVASINPAVPEARVTAAVVQVASLKVIPPTLGTATQSFGSLGSASGTRNSEEAVATQAFGGSYVAVGEAIETGVATQAFGGTSAATGQRNVEAVATSDFGGVSAATGATHAVGTATQSFGVSFTAPTTARKVLGRVTRPIIDHANGVAGIDENTDAGSPDAYMMYSQEDLFDRFTGPNVPFANDDHNFILVRWTGAVWEWDDNVVWSEFTPTNTDLLVATIGFGSGALDSSHVMLDTIQSDFNGIQAGYDGTQSDLAIIDDWWQGVENDGEFTVTGSALWRGGSVFDTVFTATGEHKVEATATQAFGGVFDALDVLATTAGTATQAFGSLGSATGERQVEATATRDFGSLGSATSDRNTTGTATQSFGVAFVAVGEAIETGVATQAFGGVSAAVGTRKVVVPGLSLDLPGASGDYAHTPDSVASSVTGDIVIRAHATMDDWTPAGPMSFVSKWVASGEQRSYAFQIATNGTLRFHYSEDGTIGTALITWATVAVSATNREDLHVKVWFDADNGGSNSELRFYESTDGVIWDQLGVTLNPSGAPVEIFDSSAIVEIGTRNTGSFEIFAGTVHSAQIYSDLAETTLVADFNPTSDADAGDTTFTSATGEVWTVSGNAEIVGTVARATFGGVSTATSERNTTGTATQGFGGVSAATGTRQVEATATQAFGGVYDALNVLATTSGTATQAFGSLGSSTGKRQVEGTATQAFGGVSTATGERKAEATATQAFGGVNTSTGERQVEAK